MKGENFCPLCGKKDGRFVKGFCLQCFLRKHRLVAVPEQLCFQQCTRCDKIRLLGKMLPLDKKAIAMFVEKKVKVRGLENAVVNVSVEETPNRHLVARILVKGIIDSVPLSFEEHLTLTLKSFQCDACMRLSSQYHEAIIQLRAKGKDKRKLKQVLPELIRLVEAQRATNSFAAVTETTETKAGFDLKVGSKKAAQSAVKQARKEFNAETKQSSKVLGRDKTGREKHRFTFLVRV